MNELKEIEEKMKAFGPGDQFGRRIVIRGYRPSGSTTHIDIEGVLRPRERRLELVQESLDNFEVMPGQGAAPADYDKDIEEKHWEAARNELRTSLEKSAAGEHEVHVSPLERVSSNGAYAKFEGEADAIYLSGIELDQPSVPSGYKETSNPKTVAKAVLRADLPVAKWLPRVKLAPGKFESVEIF